MKLTRILESLSDCVFVILFSFSSCIFSLLFLSILLSFTHKTTRFGLFHILLGTYFSYSKLSGLNYLSFAILQLFSVFSLFLLFPYFSLCLSYCVRIIDFCQTRDNGLFMGFIDNYGIIRI